MLEHCSANLHYNNHYGDHIFIEICISAVRIIFMSHSFHGLRLTQQIGLLSTWGSSHPRRPRGSKSGPEKRCDESFQAWAEDPLGTDSYRTISKRSSECWLLIGHKKCFALLCPIGEQFLLSFFRDFLHEGYYLATVARFIHQAFLTRNEGTTDELKNVSDAISMSILHWENFVSDGSQCIVNSRKFKMQQRQESKKSNWQGKTTTLHVHNAFLYFSLPPLLDYRVKTPNFTFCEGRKQAIKKFSFSLWTWIWLIEIQLQKSSLAFDKASELE